MIAIITCILLINVIAISAKEPNNLKLELVQVLFRHGDRYPTKHEIETVGPDSFNKHFENFKDFGQLTKKGMMREYKLGKMLRERYDDFLGEFKYSEVVARSSHVDRAKMSLQLVLLGLYPPTEKTAWSDEIKWTPIPTDYKEEDEFDFLYVSFFDPCTPNNDLVKELINSTVKLTKYKAIEKKLVDNTIIKALTPDKAFSYYGYITSMNGLGYPLPKFLDEEDVSNLAKAAGLFFKEMMITEARRRVLIGPTVEQMLKNIEENQEKKRKIILYSAHDTNIAFFSEAHNFTGIPAIPEFGSAVIIEQFRDGDNNVYVRMFYWAGVSEKMIPMKLESCENLCLLSKYTEIVKSMIPNEEQKHCLYSSKTYCNGRT